MWAVCDIVRMMVHSYSTGGLVMEPYGRVEVVAEFDDLWKAEREARRRVIALRKESPTGGERTVTVVPVWRVK